MAQSNEAPVLSGIPQGSVLGPILFTLFINDLPDSVTSLCKIFADDTKLYNLSTSHHIMQDDINNLIKWSNRWLLHFNADKCKVMHFGCKNLSHEYTMDINNRNMPISKCVHEKDLGVIFDNRLKFDEHIQAAISKANKMLGIIRRAFAFMDKEIFLHLYKSLVRPHLEYGNSIWCPHLKRQSSAIEKVQRRATKMITVYKNLTYKERLAILKLPSLKYRRLRGDLIQTYKIISGIDNISPQHFFKFCDFTKTRNSACKIFIKQSRITSVNLVLVIAWHVNGINYH